MNKKSGKKRRNSEIFNTAGSFKTDSIIGKMRAN